MSFEGRRLISSHVKLTQNQIFVAAEPSFRLILVVSLSVFKTN